MSAYIHECQPSDNPRYRNTCVECGRVLTTTKAGLGRNPAYEAQFLSEAAKTAERRFGLRTAGFETGVKRRLELGEDRYGNQFMSKDSDAAALDMLEEGWDLGAYAAMEATKLVAAAEDDSAAWHLFEIALYAAAAEYHARRYRQERGES